jgi:hypothetical protein
MADLFLFQRVKVEAGRPLAVPGRPHEKLGRGHPNHSSKKKSAAAFRQYIDRCERYVWIGIKQALKSLEIAKLLKWFILKLFCPAHSILNTPRRTALTDDKMTLLSMSYAQCFQDIIPNSFCPYSFGGSCLLFPYYHKSPFHYSPLTQDPTFSFTTVLSFLSCLGTHRLSQWVLQQGTQSVFLSPVKEVQ